MQLVRPLRRGSDYSASDFSWEREAGGGGGSGNGKGDKGGQSKKRKKKKVKKQLASTARPVESDPQCLAVVKLLVGGAEHELNPAEP
jgi:hypothetical protein